MHPFREYVAAGAKKVGLKPIRVILAHAYNSIIGRKWKWRIKECLALMKEVRMRNVGGDFSNLKLVLHN